MATQPHVANRGPAAASANRQALLDAARELFASRGYHVPLSSIAKLAGVGQGVLYRHFPTRLDLALAVFEENFTELEALAEADDAGAFDRLWERMVALTLDSLGFVEMVVDARRTLPAYDGDQRLSRLLGPALARAQEAGLVRPAVGVADVALGLRMVYGVATTSAEPGQTESEVRVARQLLRDHWRP